MDRFKLDHQRRRFMAGFIKFFCEINIRDVPQVGGKNASLGEMYRELTRKGVKVPNGFATTAEAFREFIEYARLVETIKTALSDLDIRDTSLLAERGHFVREAILAAELSDEFKAEISEAYRMLCGDVHDLSVAVRSSATAEDLPDASFAGQQETFLNVRGETALLDACRRCFASLFTNRAIAYRVEKGFDHFQVALSIGVQKMVRSDLAASGVIFTLDTESGFRDVVLITSAYGLGENVVQGTVNPDEFTVFKTTLREGFASIVDKRLGSKEVKLIYDARGGTRATRNVPVSASDRMRYSINDDEVVQLARWAILIEEHYQRPMDIEWGKDGETGEIFVLQARPETIHGLRALREVEQFVLEKSGDTLATGIAVGSRIGSGKARIIRSPQDMAQFQEGEVLVTEMTDPDWVPIMKRAAAIVTERGGRTCHAAIVSRELGIPAVIGADHAIARIAEGREVTVSCAEGAVGKVYDGRLPFHSEKIIIDALKKPPVKIMMNIARPDQAFSLAQLPNDGVGLARMEFLIANVIRIHPLALLRYPNLSDQEAVGVIDEMTRGFADKADYFIDRLALGIGKIAAAFYPKDVILRFSDFKTNEYAGLIGGREFEPHEENPMLGFRGASRYYNERYREGFALECRAVMYVRETMGLKNLKLMVPFCRTVEEGRRVLDEMAKNGLVRGKDGLEVYVMCEIPSNVILAHEFAEIFDGFSIGSNDLTQLILGVDRDSETVASLFDERNPAVKKMIRSVIQTAKATGKKIGICGQAPSDYPEYAEFLIECGIDSISLSPDAVLKTWKRLAGP